MLAAKHDLWNAENVATFCIMASIFLVEAHYIVSQMYQQTRGGKYQWTHTIQRHPNLFPFKSDRRKQIKCNQRGLVPHIITTQRGAQSHRHRYYSQAVQNLLCEILLSGKNTCSSCSTSYQHMNISTYDQSPYKLFNMLISTLIIINKSTS